MGLHFTVTGLGLAVAITGHRPSMGSGSNCFGATVSAHILDALGFTNCHLLLLLLLEIGFAVSAILQHQTDAELLFDRGCITIHSD